MTASTRPNKLTHPADESRRMLLRAGAASLAASAAPGLRAGPERRSGYLLKSATVLPMRDGDTPVQRADLLVRDGVIQAIGTNLAADGVETVDMAGMLLMPGLVDTHWHLWNSIARGLPESKAGPFSKTLAALARVWTPQASALGVRLGLAEAVNGGITTVNNWAHNTASSEFAEAELEAQSASGVRGRFSYGYPQSLQPDRPMDLAALDRFRSSHFSQGPSGLIDLGVCARGPDRSDQKVWRSELEAARAMRLPLSAHVASDRKAGALGNLGHMYRSGQLGPGVQIVHATHATPRDFRNMAKAGSPLSLSPWTELEVGYGLPPLGAIASSGVAVGLSVDNLVLAGSADMFSVMRLTADLAAGIAQNQSSLPNARLLAWATSEGARTLGYGGKVGTLEAGRRADIIAVRMDTLATDPVGSHEFMLTHSVHPSQVDLVMIDGVIHKRGGRLLRTDLEELRRKSRETIDGVRKAAGI